MEIIMSRIDESFPSCLEEKQEPSERFTQILEESHASAEMRDLLNKIIPNDRKKSSSNLDRLEQALRALKGNESFHEQISVFFKSFVKSSIYLPPFSVFSKDLQSQAHTPEKDIALVLIDKIVSLVFPDDPIGLYRCIDPIEKISEESFLIKYAPYFYGEEFYFSPEFIQVSLRKNHGDETMFKLFKRLIPSPFEHDSPGYYVELYCSYQNNSSKELTSGAKKFKKSVPFIEEFVSCLTDEQSAPESYDWLKKIKEYLNTTSNELKKYAESDPSPDDMDHIDCESFTKWGKEWFIDIKNKLETLWCTRVPLESITDDFRKKFNRLYYKLYIPFIHNQSPERIQKIIQWDLSQKLPGWRNNENNKYNMLNLDSDSTALWLISPYKKFWKKEFCTVLDKLSYEDQLTILQKQLNFSLILDVRTVPNVIKLPHPDKIIDNNDYLYSEKEEECYWYKGLLRELSNKNDFPKQSFTKLAIVMCQRFGPTEELAVFADKALGLLRGSISSGEELPTAHDLDCILSVLEQFKPEKALRHRLMFLSTSKKPCCKDNLEINGSNIFSSSDLDIDEYSTFSLAFSDIIAHLKRSCPRRKSSTPYSYEKENSDTALFLNEIRNWFAEYCLSRLQLRKKEKPDDNGYHTEQLMEQSPDWRQGYLKALSELNTDLNGKIHKTAHFIRKNDPDKDVCDIANECYKKSRRTHTQKQNSVDIERSLLAAYWWLLLAHRKALNLPIDYDAALLTRRRQLRK